MRRKNQSIVGVVSAAADVVLIFLAYMLAVAIRFDVLDGVVSISMNSARFQVVVWSYALIVVLAYAGFHLYQPFRPVRLWRDAGKVLLVNMAGVLVWMSLLFTFKLMDVSRGTLALFWLISSILVILRILLVGRIRQSMWKKDKYLRHVIVVGNGRNAKNYIQENYSRDISLDDVSKEVNISPYYFSKLFKEEAGENFIEYLTRIRIETAKTMLKDPNLSIKEIGVLSGYVDPNYFSRIFKKQTDMTPREYRERYC